MYVMSPVCPTSIHIGVNTLSYTEPEGQKDYSEGSSSRVPFSAISGQMVKKTSEKHKERKRWVRDCTGIKVLCVENWIVVTYCM